MRRFDHFLIYFFYSLKYQVLLVGSLTNDSQNDEQQSADSFRIAYVMSMITYLIELELAIQVLSYDLAFLGFFWTVASPIKCSLKCSAGLAYLPHFAK